MIRLSDMTIANIINVIWMMAGNQTDKEISSTQEYNLVYCLFFFHFIIVIVYRSEVICGAKGDIGIEGC